MKGLGVGVCVWAMSEGGLGMCFCECLQPGKKGFRRWVCVSILDHGWNGLGLGVYVWAMGEGVWRWVSVSAWGQGWKDLGDRCLWVSRPWVKGLKGECLHVSGDRGEEFRGFLSMSVLHTHYITYICLCYHLISVIYVLTGSRVLKHVWVHTYY